MVKSKNNTSERRERVKSDKKALHLQDFQTINEWQRRKHITLDFRLKNQKKIEHDMVRTQIT